MKTQQKQVMKRILGKIFCLTKMFNHQPKFTILMYHSVNPEHPDSILPAEFEKQIQFLTSNYQILSVTDFFNFQTNGGGIAITFDDGYEDNFYYALPILKKYNCPATFFICTGFVSKELDITKNWNCYHGLNPLTFEQIKEMKKAGMSFGCHTHSHPILTKIQLKEARNEINKSKTILENILGEQIDSFTYPFGELNTFNKSIISILTEAKLKLACTSIYGRNTKKTNQLILYRIGIDPQDTIDDFTAKVQGSWDFLKVYRIFKKRI
ncbi:MAG: polysaccharide deacetylase family protein [Elusimicrobiota bacterium]